MLFQVEKNDLHAALQAANRAVSPRTPMPVLQGILIEVENDKARLTASDLELAVQASIPVVSEQNGRIVLPARYLTEFVRRIPYGTIQVSVPEGSQQATLKWQKSEYVIQGFPAEQFPPVGQVTGSAMEFPQALLKDMLLQTSFAVSNDETKPALMGVNVTIDSGQAAATATDGYRVAIRQAAIDGPSGVETILPGRALAEVARLLSDDDDDKVMVAIDDKQAEFNMGRVRFISSVIQGPYPNLSAVLPREYPMSAVVDRVALQDAVERASLLAVARQMSYPLVIFELESGKDRLVITANDPEVGQAYEEIPAETGGTEIRIGLNASFVLDGLRHIEDESLKLEFIDPGKTMRMTGANRPDYMYVLSPIRL